MKLTVAACILLFGMISNSDAQQQAKVTGFFSNMRFVREAGDVLGMEVWIVDGGSYYACVQIAQGAPQPPSCVPAQVSGSKITFSIRQRLVDQNGKPVPDFVAKFSGNVMKDALRLDGGEVLKRGTSYWQ